MNQKLRNAALMIAVLAGSAGLAAAQGWYGGDDYRYGNGQYSYGYNDGYGYNFRMLTRVARDFGFRDGSQVAREDTWRGKPFNPNPRGPYDDADHGYRRRLGDKHTYRQIYSEAYRRGYQSAFRGYGYGNGYNNGYYR